MAHRGRKNADDVIILTMACGGTAESAAAKAGVSRRTVTRRLAEPTFKKRLGEAKADIVRRTTGMLTAASLESVKTLVELQNPANSAAVRLGAARSVLELSVKFRESTDMEERIAALEAQVETSRPD